MQPQVMCAHCDGIFPSSIEGEVTVRCPHCGHEGKPGRIMQPTGFPDEDTFVRNWQKAHGNAHLNEGSS